MTDLLSDPPRWRSEERQANVAERAAGEVIRSMSKAEPLSPAQLARIAAVVRGHRPHRQQRWVMVFAAFLLGIATTASAAHFNVLPAWLGGAKPKPAGEVPHDSHQARASRSSKASVPAQPALGPEESVEPIALPPPAEALPGQAEEASVKNVPSSAAAAATAIPSASPKPKRELAGTAAAVHAPADVHASPVSSVGQMEPPPPAILPPPTSAASGSAVAGGFRGTRLAWVDRPEPAPATANPSKEVEPASRPSGAGGTAKHLAEAIRVLRVERNPKAALAVLDRHTADMAKSALGHEVLLLRVEALLALDRRGEVLGLLDGAALSDVAASHSLLLTRGRLRAEANRCADGVGDFDLVLAESRQPERQALFGRALCRKQLGDLAGARADLDRYRREFPTDPRLGELEKRLGGGP